MKYKLAQNETFQIEKSDGTVLKAVSTEASQGLSDTEKSNARANIGAGTSSFSGSYNDLSNKPYIPLPNNGTYTVKTLVGSTTTNVSDFSANQSSADDVTFVQGSNVTITPDATDRKITIAAKDTTYSEATTSEAGLMSSSDKSKLNGIESGAQTHKAPTTAEVKSALNTVTASQGKYLKDDGTWDTPAGGSNYESKSAVENGTDVSLVTTGEKYAWNQKQDAITFNTAYNASTNKAATMSDITKANVGLGNVDNTSDATKKSNFTGSIASENTGFVTGGAAYTALAGKADLDDNGHVEAEQLDANYPDLVAGNIVGEFTQEANVSFRPSAGSTDILTGYQVSKGGHLQGIKGNTIAWNQLVDTDTTQVTPVNGRKICTVIDGVKSIVTSDGSAIIVSGGIDMVFDLTIIYGAGNEPSTVAQFEADYLAWFGKSLGYEPYDAGSLRPVKMTGIKTVGFNAWDEEWVHGYVEKETGNVRPVYTGTIASKNLIPVVHDATYYFMGYGYITMYDANQAVVGQFIKNNDTFDIGTNVRYIRFHIDNYGTTYNHDICINLSHSGARDGEYEPYWESMLNVPVTTMKGKLNGEGSSVVVFPDGLKKAGTVYDEIVVENGVTKAIKRVGSRAYQSGDVSGSTIITDGVATTFYQLATQEEYILDDFELPLDYDVDDYGTEEVIAPTGQITVAPKLSLRYGINAPDTIRNLHHNFVSATQEQNFTEEQKARARINIGAGTSSFSGSYSDLSNKPNLDSIADGSTRKLADYLPLSGGTMTGNLTMSGTNILMNGANNRQFGFIFGSEKTHIDVGYNFANADGSGAYFRSSDYSGQEGCFGFYARKTSSNFCLLLGTPSGTLTWGGNTVYHSGNLTSLPASDVSAWAKASTKPSYTLDEVSDGSTRKLSNYLPLSGGTLTGSVTFANSTWNVVGDDSEIGDIDVGGTLGVKGVNGQTAIAFVNKDNSRYTRVIAQVVSSNINVTLPSSSGTLALVSQIPTNNNQLTNGAGYITSSGSCNYATTAGSTESCIGNAATATKLQTARTIWGQSFDGSANINGTIDFYNNQNNVVRFSAGETLDCSGNFHFSARASSWNIFGDNNNNVLLFRIVRATGNVGIGEEFPSYKLHVNGSFNAISGYINGNDIIHAGNIGSQSVSYATTAGSAPASDVYGWAKASTKPTYTLSEVGASMRMSLISSNTSSSCSITGSSNTGKIETIIYLNDSTSDVTVTVPTNGIQTPDRQPIELTVPGHGYCEISYLNIGGIIYARGL